MIVEVLRVAPDGNPAIASLEAWKVEKHVCLMMPKTSIKILPASARALADRLYRLAAEIETEIETEEEAANGQR